MIDRTNWSRTTAVLVNLAAAVVVIAAVRSAAELIVPFLLALFLAAIIAPSIDHLADFGVPRWLAVALVILIFSVIALLGLAYLGVSINELLWRLPEIQGELTAWRDHLLDRAEALGLPTAEARNEAVVFDPAYGVRLLGGLLAGLSNIFSNGLLIGITVVFALLESVGYPAKLRAIFGAESPALPRIVTILGDLRRYMVIKTWVSLATGTPVAIGLWLLGVEHAVLWGILTFLLNYVPTIGSLIAAIPPVVLAMVQDGWPVAVGAAVLFLTVNFVVGYLIEPPAMGRSLGLSTLVVWVSLVFWGWVLGPVGMFLSVPLTMALKIVFEGSEETRWLSVLLGPAIEASPAAPAEAPR